MGPQSRSLAERKGTTGLRGSPGLLSSSIAASSVPDDVPDERPIEAGLMLVEDSGCSGTAGIWSPAGRTRRPFVVALGPRMGIPGLMAPPAANDEFGAACSGRCAAAPTPRSGQRRR